MRTARVVLVSGDSSCSRTLDRGTARQGVPPPGRPCPGAL